MSEPVGEVAGRLSVVVEASLAGFRRKLKSKVESAAKGIKAEVGVEIDAKKLRKDLQAKVSEASKGVTAKIGIEVEGGLSLAAKVQALADNASTTTTVKVEADSRRLTAETVAAAEAAEDAARPIRVPMRARVARFFAEVAAARAAAQASADRAGGGVNIPLTIGGRRPRLRSLLRGGAIFGLLSLVQPAVGAIGQVVAGLTAIVGAGAPAVGVLNAIPISLAAIIQGAVGGKIALQGVSDAMEILAEKRATLARGDEWSKEQQKELNEALKNISPSARVVARDIISLGGAWTKMRKHVQEEFFSRIADDVKPLAEKYLPLLEARLGGTAARLGDAGQATSKWLQTRHAQLSVGKVMRNNNIILSDFLYMIGQFSKGSIDFLVGSRRFGRGVGDTMRKVGDWFSGKMQAGRESGSINDFLDRASEKATRLWNIVKQFGGGMAGIFRAGSASGERLLWTFEQFLTRWHEWVDSAEGQDYLRDWFTGAEDGFIEFSRLINDTFKGLAKWASDPKIAAMIEKIRTELGPAIGGFLEDLADDAGPGVLDFLTQLARTIENLEPAVEVVSLLTGAITGLLAALNDLADANPGTTENIAKILGGLILLRTLTGGRRGASLLGRLGGAGGAAGAGAGAAAGGGLLSRLFGRGGAGAARGARGGLMRKAGGIGLALTAADMISGLAAAHGFGEEQAAAMAAGFADGAATPSARKVVRDAFFKNFEDRNSVAFGSGLTTGITGALGGNRDLMEFARKIGINTTALEEEISRLGNTGPLYKDALDQLSGIADSYGDLWKNPAFGLPGVDTDQENARALADDLRKIGDDAQSALDQAAADLKRSVAGYDESMLRLFGPTVGIDVKTIDKWKRRQERMLARLRNQSSADAVTASLADPARGPKSAQNNARNNTRGVPNELLEGMPLLADMPDDWKARVRKNFKKTQAEYDQFTAGLLDSPALGKTAKPNGRKLWKTSPLNPENMYGKPPANYWDQYLNGSGKGKNSGLSGALASTERAVKQGARGISRPLARVATNFGQTAKKIDRQGRRVEKSVKAAFDGKEIRGGKTGLSKALNGVERDLQKTTKTTARTSRSITRNLRDVSRSGGKVFDAVARDAKQGMNKVEKHAQQGMRGVVTSVQKAKGPAGAASRGVATSVKQPMSGLAGPMSTAGRNAMAGFTAGIRAEGANAVAAARSIAAQVEAATRKRLDIRSPSRVMKRLGAWVSEGFAIGIRGTLKKVEAAQEGLWKRLSDTKMSKDRIKSLRKRFADEFSEIEKAAKKRDRLNDRLTRASNQLERLRGEKAASTAALTSSAAEYSSIATISEENGGYATPASLIASLTDRLNNTKLFARTLARLRKKGLGKKAYQQILDLGIEAGLPLAQQLATGSKSDISRINKLQAAIAAQAKKTAAATAKTYYDAGIKSGAALVAKLKREQRELNKVAEKMAKALVKQLRRALGLKTEDEKGDKKNDQPKGNGGEKKPPPDPKPKPKPKGGGGDRVRAAARTARAGSSRRAGVVAGRRVAAYAPDGTGGAFGAPGALVGELHLHGVKDRAAAADVLDEAYFALRKIRHGGLYADRTA